MKITYMSNAGLLIAAAKRRVMVDGLHGGVGPFSRLPSEVIEQVFAEGSPWRDVDCLAFTHTHPDHYDRELTDRYMAANSKSTLMLPKLTDRDHLEWKERTALMEAELWQTGEADCGGVHIKYFRTAHEGAEYSSIPHYSLLVTIGEEKVLILGDADFRRAELKSLVRGLRPEAAIVNFLVTNSAIGRNLIKNVVEAGCAVVCHLPLKSEDRFGYIRVACRDVEKYSGELPPVHVFTAPFESFDTGYSM